jgi:hypothetical protein
MRAATVFQALDLYLTPRPRRGRDQHDRARVRPYVHGDALGRRWSAVTCAGSQVIHHVAGIVSNPSSGAPRYGKCGLNGTGSLFGVNPSLIALAAASGL